MTVTKPMIVALEFGPVTPSQGLSIEEDVRDSALDFGIRPLRTWTGAGDDDVARVRAAFQAGGADPEGETGPPDEARVDAALDVLRAAGWSVTERSAVGVLTGTFLAYDYTGAGKPYTSTMARSPWTRAVSDG